MSRFFDWIVKIEQWSYFIFAIICIMGSFVHLHIKLQDSKCSDSAATANLQAQSNINGLDVKCLGRNLVWLSNHHLSTDSNAQYWRTVFTLEPDQFIDIWSPFFVSILALMQHFKGLKWDFISNNVLRTFIFTLFWMLFTVIGYAANWGVFVGITGVLWLGLLDAILLVTNHGDVEPVLQFDIGMLSKIRNRGNSQAAAEQQQQQQQQDEDAPKQIQGQSMLDEQEMQNNNVENMNNMNTVINNDKFDKYDE